MNWLTVLQGIFKLVPYVVAGIDVVHQNETTETKTQLAQDALSVATQAASAVLSPGDATIANAVSSAVATAIAGSQQVIAAIKTPAPATSTTQAVA
jgi:hypothetical protein